MARRVGLVTLNGFCRTMSQGGGRRLTLACMLIGALLAIPGTTAAASEARPASYAQALSGTLNIGGSTALQPLVERAATNFQKANEGVQITVMDGGSSAGRTGVCQGSLDIGMSDVPLTSAEMSSLQCGDAVQTAVAMDAFAVVANPAGPGALRALDREQMQHIFSGDVQNWQDIEGADQRLVVINRVRGSGTRQSMANYLFNGDDTVFTGTAQEEDNSQNLTTALSQTPGSISYLGLAYLNKPNVLTIGIQQPDGTVILPSHDTVARNEWPIGGPGVAITRGQPSALASEFLNYLIGPQFQSDSSWTDLGLVAPSNPAIGNQYGQ
jgi:phosphate transport system substrate-binding protein